MLNQSCFNFLSSLVILLGLASAAEAQFSRTVPASAGARIEVRNLAGKVEIRAVTVSSGPLEMRSKPTAGEAIVEATSSSPIGKDDLVIVSGPAGVSIDVRPKDAKKRIDVLVRVPERTRLILQTRDGEARISGSFVSADIKTDTGTIAADVPTVALRYLLRWTSSRPRFLSEFDLEKVKERTAGKFEIKGTHHTDESTGHGTSPNEKTEPDTPSADVTDAGGEPGNEKPEKKKPAPGDDNSVSLTLETARGIILINIPPNEVSSDLRERPLTTAAKAIIRSGDSLLMEAIRRAAPQYYGDYMRTLGPVKLEPSLGERKNVESSVGSSVKLATVRVSDINNRAIGDLKPEDFEVLENGVRKEVLAVRPSTAPFNLVLLLDVSGSVDNYVNFIRKAARSFVNTVDENDRVSIITFNDDVKVISRFTTDKKLLSESLDTFDAGGPTAYYDALAYTLADTLRPLKGDRTAIVVLTDGDDNRSFLPFDSMLGSIQESGALIYPLYVPSALIAAAESDPSASVDALRQRFLQGELTSKAKGEGERLAQVSGGVYYQIDRLSQIDAAYQDIVKQLRSAYQIEYRSDLAGIDTTASPRLRVRTTRPSSFVQIRSVVQIR